MGGSSTVSGKLDDPDKVELKAKITVVAVLVLFLVLFFIFLLHVYIKWYLDRRREELSASNSAAAAAAASTRRRPDFTPNYQELTLRRGLDSSMLKTIPVVVFSAKDFKDGFECSVCLCQLIEGEKARFLPKCNHGFHVECIDMWFQSHSSCPICRNLILSQSNLSPEDSSSILEAPNAVLNPESSESPPNFPTNVLFWGNDFEVRTLGNYMEDGHQQVVNLADPSSSFPSSSSSSRSGVSNSNTRLNGGALVIDVSQQVNEDEEAKSPAQTRFRSLKRLLSKDCKRVGPCNARDIDVELATRS